MLNKIPVTKLPLLKKVPEYLVLHKNIKYGKFITEDCFILFSTKDSSQKAIMYCSPEKIYRKDMGRVKSLCIGFITALDNKGQGFGTKLMNIARKFSYEQGCEGRLHLEASGSLYKDRAPHIFYKKYGMNTGNQEIDAHLDNCIKKGKNATADILNTMRMYYPPIEQENIEKGSLIKRIFKSILKCFKGRN